MLARPIGLPRFSRTSVHPRLSRSAPSKITILSTRIQVAIEISLGERVGTRVFVSLRPGISLPIVLRNCRNALWLGDNAKISQFALLRIRESAKTCLAFVSPLSTWENTPCSSRTPEPFWDRCRLSSASAAARNSLATKTAAQQNSADLQALVSLAMPAIWSSCQCVATTSLTASPGSTPILRKYPNAWGLPSSSMHESTTTQSPFPM